MDGVKRSQQGVSVGRRQRPDGNVDLNPRDRAHDHGDPGLFGRGAAQDGPGHLNLSDRRRNTRHSDVLCEPQVERRSLRLRVDELDDRR
jgi:hypothetical protein